MYLSFVVAQFGAGRAGLGTVGYRFYTADGAAYGARVSTGVLDLGEGNYGADVTIEDVFQGVLRWDTGEAIPVYVRQPVNPTNASLTWFLLFQFGSGNTGMGSVGYRLYDTAGVAVGSRITAGVVEFGDGDYGALVLFPSLTWRGTVRADDGATVPQSLALSINLDSRDVLGGAAGVGGGGVSPSIPGVV